MDFKNPVLCEGWSCRVVSCLSGGVRASFRVRVRVYETRTRAMKMGIETRTREVEVCHKNSIPNPNPNPISSPNLYQEGRDLGGIEVVE